MRIALMVFPRLEDTHSPASASSDLGQRLEPSVLALSSRRPGDTNIFIPDNTPRPGVDLYLCSIYTRGWQEFTAFAEQIGRDKIIAGGYHPTARPHDTLPYAATVVTGLCGNIEAILDQHPAGVLKGQVEHRLMDRTLINMDRMRQIYPDAMPHMRVGSSVSSVGCPYDCDFCATPLMSGRTMNAFPLDLIAEDIADLQRNGTEVLFIRDESFITHPRFNEVVPMYGAAGFPVLYSFGTAAAMSEKKVRLLADNNWHSVCLGLEDIGKSYKKNAKIQEACDRCRDAGVGVTLSFIVNDAAHQDKASILEHYKALTTAFFALQPIMTCANFFMPLPGTMLGRSYTAYESPDFWARFDSKTPLFSQGPLEALHRTLAVLVQTNWYRSPAYDKLRTFAIGDTLHLRMEELERAFVQPHQLATLLTPEEIAFVCAPEV